MHVEHRDGVAAAVDREDALLVWTEYEVLVGVVGAQRLGRIRDAQSAGLVRFAVAGEASICASLESEDGVASWVVALHVDMAGYGGTATATLRACTPLSAPTCGAELAPFPPALTELDDDEDDGPAPPVPPPFSSLHPMASMLGRAAARMASLRTESDLRSVMGAPWNNW